MANLKEIRTRIQSVQSTRKITSAMKMVSAAKFHKAQETIFRFYPYSKKVFEVLAQAFQGVLHEEETKKWFTECSEPKKVAFLVITSNSSMCGGFNQNLIKKVQEEGSTKLSNLWDNNSIDFYCIGKKGSDYFLKKGLSVKSTDTETIDKPNFQSSAKYADMLMETFLNNKYDTIYVAYNQFKNPAVQVPVIERFLPIEFPKNIKVDTTRTTVFEPDSFQIVKTIIPKSLRIKMHGIILEVSAGEHGARMTAMHQATDNATDLIRNLTLQYNKARQAAITKEILEIVSGAEALKG